MVKLQRSKAFLLITLFTMMVSGNEIGEASWYGKQHHGRGTAQSTPRKMVYFDMYAMTAAHRTLKFGTKVKVTNLKNGKSCVVTINDRGPYARRNSGVVKDERIIDLSYAAAQSIGIQGIGKVSLEVIP